MIARALALRARRPVAVAALVSLAFVAVAGAARPKAPEGARVLPAGHLPAVCTEGEAGTPGDGAQMGVYFDTELDQWLSAPACTHRWRNLEASPAQHATAGKAVTVTAIPNEGSNSGTYAPQTNSITWRHPGKRVAGCGSADLTCTFVPAATATDSWQWVVAHVTMPRTFFIDSPGSNCAGQHLCAGFATNAWSWIGVKPKGATPGFIKGRVVDEDGKAMPGVRVRADGPASKSTSTGRDGRYEMTIQKAGRYTVKASNGAGVFTPRSDAVQVRRGSTAKSNFRLSGCSTRASAAKKHAYGGGPSRIGSFTASWDDCTQDVNIKIRDGRASCQAGYVGSGDDYAIIGDEYTLRYRGEWSFKANGIAGGTASFGPGVTTKASGLGRLWSDGEVTPVGNLDISVVLSAGRIGKRTMEFKLGVGGSGPDTNGETICKFSARSHASNEVILTSR